MVRRVWRPRRRRRSVRSPGDGWYDAGVRLPLWCPAFVALAVLGSACGDDDAARDGGVDAGSDAAIVLDGGQPTPPAPPAEAALPVLTPCPPGWSERAPSREGAPAACEPWPIDATPACAPSQAWFPGASGCEHVGAACPIGEWPEGLPAGTPVRYVRSGAAGGDGSIDAPFGTIDEALAGAAPGTTIALARGDHVAGITVAADVTLWGACPDATTLRTTAAPTVVTVTAGTTTIRDLRIVGPGEGVRVSGDAGAVLSGVVVDGASRVGIVATGGARLSGERLVVTGTAAGASGELGYGAAAIGGASLSLAFSWIERSVEMGVFVDDAPTTLSLTDVAIVDTQPGSTGLGIAVGVGHGAVADIARVVAETSRGAALVTQGGENVLRASDIVVRKTLPMPDGTSGVGLTVLDGTMAEVRRALFEQNRLSGIAVSGASIRAAALLEDIVVIATEAQDGMQGAGIAVLEVGDVDGRRIWLESNRVAGLGVTHTGFARIEDLTILDTRPQSDEGELGLGIAIENGGVADITRARVEQSTEIGVHVRLRGMLTARDLIVRDTRSSARGTMGRGLNVQGATASITRALFERNAEVSLFASDEFDPMTGEPNEGRLAATDVVVRDTQPAACVVDACSGRAGGSGAVSVNGASLDLERFEIADSVFCGVQVGPDAEMDLLDGVVSGNEIGANVQNPRLDVSRLSNGVRYVDNRLTFDSTGLPLPESR